MDEARKLSSPSVEDRFNSELNVEEVIKLVKALEKELLAVHMENLAEASAEALDRKLIKYLDTEII